MKDKLLVNGPLNAIRLEGKIGTTSKVVYLFGDIHMDVRDQTECPDQRATEFKNYMIDQFDNITGSDKYVDMFLEIYPTYSHRTLKHGCASCAKLPAFREKYILTLRKLFHQSFEFDQNINKVTRSKEFPNVRLHYADVRAYLGESAMDTILSTGSYLRNMRPTTVNLYDLLYIKDGLTITNSYMIWLYKELYPSSSSQKGGSTKLPVIPASAEALRKYTPENFKTNAKHLLTKMTTRYKYADVKTKIEYIVNNELKTLFQQYMDTTKKLDDMLQKVTTDKTIKTMYHKNNNESSGYGTNIMDVVKIRAFLEINLTLAEEQLMDIFVLIMDIYLIRRILDKDYISNAVTYTGYQHTSNHLYILVKYFDFKITNHSYLQKDVAAATKDIKNTTDIRKLDTLITPELLQQCTDLTGFPENFQ